MLMVDLALQLTVFRYGLDRTHRLPDGLLILQEQDSNCQVAAIYINIQLCTQRRHASMLAFDHKPKLEASAFSFAASSSA